MDQLDHLQKSRGKMVFTTNQRDRELNAHQKASFITLLLRDGNVLTTAGIARLIGTTWEGAEFMMEMISGVVPVVKIDGKWQWDDKQVKY